MSKICSHHMHQDHNHDSDEAVVIAECEWVVVPVRLQVFYSKHPSVKKFQLTQPGGICGSLIIWDSCH